MPRDQRLLPGGQGAVEVRKRLGGLDLQLGQFVGDGDAAVALADRSQLLDLGFKFRDGFFEIEIGAHHAWA